MKRGFDKKVYFAALVSFLIILTSLGMVYRSTQLLMNFQFQIAEAEDRINRSANLAKFVLDLESGERGFMLSADPTYLEYYNVAEADFEQYYRESESAFKDFPAQQKRLAEMADLKKQWIEGPAVNEMMARRKLSINMITLADFVKLFKSSGGKTLTDRIRDLAKEARLEEDNRISQYKEKLQNCAKNMRLLSLLVFACVAVGFGLIALVTRKLSLSIKNSIDQLSEVRGGLSQMTRQIASASQELSQAVLKQEDLIKSTSSTSQRVSHIANKNSEQASSSKDLAYQSGVQATKSKEAMQMMVGAMQNNYDSNQQISQKIMESNAKIAGLTAIIVNVGVKTQVINDIVFQTRLLSFNASVEAARAGEHGKGFSVVAEEIGKLANSSGEAATEITSILQTATNEVKSIAEEINQSIGQVIKAGLESAENAVKITKDCQQTLEGMITSVGGLQGSLLEISQSTIEQVGSIDQINGSIVDLEKICKKTTQTSINTALYAEELTQESDKLTAIVQRLDAQINGQQS